MFKNLGTAEFLIVGVVLLMLFGQKKMTELARGLGKSKKELENLQKEYESAMGGGGGDSKKKKKKKKKKKSSKEVNETRV